MTGEGERPVRGGTHRHPLTPAPEAERTKSNRQNSRCESRYPVRCREPRPDNSRYREGSRVTVFAPITALLRLAVSEPAASAQAATMSNVDMSLDDIIDKSTLRRGGRTAAPRANAGRAPAGGRAPGTARGGRPAPARRSDNARSNTRAAPYARASGGRAPGGRKNLSESDHMAGADVRDLAASRNPLLKVSSESKPNSVAGAICNIVRENARNNPPAVMATGPAAINQAMKAIAIARKYLLDEEEPIDLLVFPKFEQDIREGSNMIFELKRSNPIAREPSEVTPPPGPGPGP